MRLGSPFHLLYLGCIEKLLSISSFFLSCSFPGVLAKESRLMLRLLLSVPVGISKLLASLPLSLVSVSQKGNTENLLP